MVSKRAHNQVKETPMQPYQTIVSIYRMAALFCASMQQVTMKYAKNILQLLEQGQ